LNDHQLKIKLNAVPVFKGGGFIREEIDRFLTAPADYNIHTDYHFGGYGKANDELIIFIKQFVAATGILIEPVYTGKMMFALYNQIAKGHFEPGSRILAIHSGGIWGLLGMKEKFN
jgi:1-aminocyclopropane-1-carboxylate deaminase